MPERKPFPKKVDDWKAPWELDPETGEELPEDQRQIDPARLKNYLFGLLTDKLSLQTRVDAGSQKVEELERSIAEAPDAAALTALQTQLAEARQAAEAAKNNPNNALALKYEIALEKGLTKAQARRLVGETREDIESDAEELVKDLGVRQQQQDPAGGNEDGTRQQPRTAFTNPADPNPGADSGKLPSPDEVYKAWVASR